MGACLSALGAGVAASPAPPPQGPQPPDLPAQAAIRLDGTAFTAGILQAVHSGQPRLSPAYVPESLLITVPSSLWSSKLAHGTALNPDSLETGSFGLQQVNFLPTLPGLYAGFLSPPWLALFLAFLGLLCGWGERWLFRHCTPARFVLLAGGHRRDGIRGGPACNARAAPRSSRDRGARQDHRACARMVNARAVN